MGLWQRLFGTAPTTPPPAAPPGHPTSKRPPLEQRGRVPIIGDSPHRYDTPDQLPAMRLQPYEPGQWRLIEDTTGLWIRPGDPRLIRAGIYTSSLRGPRHHRAACRAGDFTPGARVRLVREPDNEYDRNAIAVTADEDGAQPAAYVNKQIARSLAKALDAGEELVAISTRGTRARSACDAIGILATRAEVLEHLLSPRPRGAHRPVRST